MSDLVEKLKEKTKGLALNQRPRGAGLQIFLAQKDEIKKAVEEGFPYLEIFDMLQEQGDFPLKYPSFCTYIWKYITSVEAEVQQKDTPQNKNINKIKVPPDSGNSNKNKLPRGYDNAPKKDLFMDGDDDMPDIFESNNN